MTQYSIEPRTRKYVKGYGFLSFVKKFSNKVLPYELPDELPNDLRRRILGN